MGSQYQQDAKEYVEADDELSKAKKGSAAYFRALVRFITASEACARSCVIAPDRKWYEEKAHKARIRLEQERNPK